MKQPLKVCQECEKLKVISLYMDGSCDYACGCPSCEYREAYSREKERTVNKPIRIDEFTEKCPKCGEKVMYAVGTGTIFHGASESYEDWRVIKHNYCPRCGTKIEREGADDEQVL